MAEMEEKKVRPSGHDVPRPPRHPSREKSPKRRIVAGDGAAGSKSTEDAATASGGAGGGLGLPAEDDTGELLAYGGYLPEMPDASTARAKVKSIKGAAKKKKKKKRKSKAASSAPLERRGGGYSLPGEPTQRPFHDSRVIELFHPDRDAEVPYVEQGDPSMYTPKMLQRRAELKTNPGLQDAIKRFSKLFRWGSGGTTMSKADYMAMHARLVAALLPHATEAAAARLAEADWEVDAKGAEELTYDQFFDAVFTLVDHWTQSADASEYLAFVDALCLRCKYAPSAKSALEPSATISPAEGADGVAEAGEGVALA